MANVGEMSKQELIGLSIFAKRRAHAMNNGISVEESQKRTPITEILDDPAYAIYAPSFLNGSSADRG